MKISQTSGLACAAVLLTSPMVLSETQSELEALQARVDALETELSSDILSGPRLQFSATENTSVELYGFVRTEAFYDFDFAQGDLSRAGRVGDPDFATDGEFDTSVRVSRFGLRSTTGTDIGDIKTQLEFDLFGSGGDESSSPNLRLRHANVQIGDSFLVGQTWTNFMPLQHYPTTADFNGPVGISFARVPQARYTYNSGSGLQFSTSIEEAAGGSSDPVVTAAGSYTGSNFSVRAAALAGTFNDGDDELDTNGFTLSGSVSPWQGGTLSATYINGEGIGNLLIGGGVRSVDGEVNEAEGYTVGISQDLSEKITLGLNYGNESYDLATTIGASDNAFTDLESVHASLFYKPVDSLTLAAEYITIASEGPGFSDDADRIGLSATFSF